MELTTRPDTQLPSEVNGVVFEGDCYRLEHEEKKLMLYRWNIRRIQGADVVD
jgi:hypothetical protein